LDGAAAKVFEEELLVALLANLVAVVNGKRLGDGHLAAVVRHLAIGHYLAHPPKLKVALLRVHDDVEVLVGAEFFLDQRAEHVFQHPHHRRAVNVFAGLEIGKDIY
jgi:hypothetical protein